MKKIISLFQREIDSGLVKNEITPGAEWVAAGEGVATRKWDGCACLIQNGHLFGRARFKFLKDAPPDFILMDTVSYEDYRGAAIVKHYGFIPVLDQPQFKWHRRAWLALPSPHPPDGTYELCGPKVQGGAEGFLAHVLIRHGADIVCAPRTFDELRSWFTDRDIEGIVWRHPDGRMAKIKGVNFGIKRPSKPKTFEHD